MSDAPGNDSLGFHGVIFWRILFKSANWETDLLSQRLRGDWLTGAWDPRETCWGVRPRGAWHPEKHTTVPEFEDKWITLHALQCSESALPSGGRDEGGVMRGWGVVWSAGVVGRESGSKNSLVPLLGIALLHTKFFRILLVLLSF